MSHHSLDKYPVSSSRILYEDVGHGADQLAVLDDGLPLTCVSSKDNIFYFLNHLLVHYVQEANEQYP